MTVKYVTPGPWGAGEGSPLPATDVDNNFWDHEGRIGTMEDNPPVANSISTITVSGNQFTVWLQDGTPIGPLTMPEATFEFRGEWVAAEAYFVNDWFTYERAGLYRVVQDHVSESTFDPGESDDDGNYYQLLLELFSGSAVKQVSTTTYIPVLLDNNRYIRTTHVSGCTVTIPANDDVEFPINTELHFRQHSDGALVIVGDGGVTINPSRPDYDTALPWKGANATVKKVAANEWDYIGPGTEPA